MRTRIIAVLVVCLVAAVAVVWFCWQTAGHAEMRAITERVAAAAACGDREALLTEPILHDVPGTVDFLLGQGPALANGYRVTVCENGADGYRLLPSVVTHLGRIKTSSGTVDLGFRYDRGSARLEFVLASFTSIPL